MKIFQTIRKLLKIMGIEPTQSTRMFTINLKLTFGFLFVALSIILSAMYIIYLANTALEYIQCFYMICLLLSLGLCFVAIVGQNERLFNYIEIVEKLINKRLENPTSKAIHGETNRQVEKFCKILDVGMSKVMPQFIIWPTFVISFIKYFSTDLGSEAFELPFMLWLPFNWTNPIGYPIAIAIEGILFTYDFHIPTIIISIGIASYLYETSVTEDIKTILRSIDENSKTKKNRQKLYTQFTEFIDFHSDTKQTASIFSNLYQPIFMIFFPRAMLGLCASMLLIQLQISHRGDYGGAIIFLAVDAFNLFVLIFLCCELSQRLSDAFDEINDIIDQYKWYLFPEKLRRILPTMMIISQKPVTMECFGSISCCREVFQKICNRTFSYFMVLRQFIK